VACVLLLSTAMPAALVPAMIFCSSDQVFAQSIPGPPGPPGPTGWAVQPIV